MVDVIIIGAGTAGLSAAIYVQRSGKRALVLEKLMPGGQIVNTPEVANYPGIKNISGFDFASGLLEQATELGAELEVEEAAKIETFTSEDGKEAKRVVSASGKVFEGRAVIIATGAKNRHLGLDKEEKLVGRGVSYCATCDGAFFKGKPVAVNGGGNTALEDALFLSGYCSKVYLIHRRDAFRGEKDALVRLQSLENVEFVLNSTITDLVGDKKLEGVQVTDKLTGEVKQIDVDGLFIAIGQEPDNAAFADVAELDAAGYVKASEDCTTRTRGVFTAGDCRTKAVRQLTTAASDGAVAALAACAYIGSL